MNSILILLMPAFIAIALLLTPARYRFLPRAITCASATALFFIMLSFAGRTEAFSIPWIGGGFDFALRLTPLSSVFICLLYGLSLPALVYLLGKPDSSKKEDLLIITALSFSTLVFLADNPAIFTMGWLLTLLPYFILTVKSGSYPARAAGMKLLIFQSVSGFAAGAGLLLALNSSAESMMPAVGRTAFASESIRLSVSLLLILAAAVKAGIFPFGTWIDDAADNIDTATGALFFGVWDKLIAAYLMIIAFNFLPWEAGGITSLIILLCGLAVSLLAALSAYCEDDLKKMVWRAAAAQSGIFIIALAAGTAAINYSIVLCALSIIACAFGAIIACAVMEGGANAPTIENAGTLFKTSRAACVLFLASGLALAGVFPLSGFFPSCAVYLGLSANGWGWAFIFYTACQILCVAAFAKAGYAMLHGKAEDGQKQKLSLTEKLTLAASAALIILLSAGGLPAHKFLVPTLTHYLPGAPEIPSYTETLIVAPVSIVALLSAFFMGKRAALNPFQGFYGMLSQHLLWSKILSVFVKDSFKIYPLFMHAVFTAGRAFYAAGRALEFTLVTLPSYLTELFSILLTRAIKGSYTMRLAYMLAGAAVFFTIFSLLGGAG
ncbi:MAG: proton-conducting transporter membrane subunit [Elusimicrobiaceae bacterium]